MRLGFASWALLLAALPSPLNAQQAATVVPIPVPRTNFLATMDAEFRRMDANKNNVVTRLEIEQYQRATAAARAQARSRTAFAALDSDKNGQLSPAEFDRLQKIPQPNATPVLAQADLDKDGTVTLVEYRTAKLANFDRMDADKDGIVSVAEMKAAGLLK